MPGLGISIISPLGDLFKAVQSNVSSSDQATRNKFTAKLIKIGVSRSKAIKLSQTLSIPKQKALLTLDIEDGSFSQAVLPHLKSLRSYAGKVIIAGRVVTDSSDPEPAPMAVMKPMKPVMTVPETDDAEEPEPEKPLPKPPSLFWPIARLVGIGLGLILVGVLTFLGIRRRRKTRALQEAFDAGKSLHETEVGRRFLKEIANKKIKRLISRFEGLQGDEAAKFLKIMASKELGPTSERVGYLNAVEMVRIANIVVASQKYQEGTAITSIDLKVELANLRKGEAEPVLKPPTPKYDLGETFLERMERLARERGDTDDPNKNKGAGGRSGAKPSRKGGGSAEGGGNGTSAKAAQARRAKFVARLVEIGMSPREAASLARRIPAAKQAALMTMEVSDGSFSRAILQKQEQLRRSSSNRSIMVQRYASRLGQLPEFSNMSGGRLHRLVNRAVPDNGRIRLDVLKHRVRRLHRRATARRTIVARRMRVRRAAEQLRIARVRARRREALRRARELKTRRRDIFERAERLRERYDLLHRVTERVIGRRAARYVGRARRK